MSKKFKGKNNAQQGLSKEQIEMMKMSEKFMEMSEEVSKKQEEAERKQAQKVKDKVDGIIDIDDNGVITLTLKNIEVNGKFQSIPFKADSLTGASQDKIDEFHQNAGKRKQRLKKKIESEFGDLFEDEDELEDEVNAQFVHGVEERNSKVDLIVDLFKKNGDEQFDSYQFKNGIPSHAYREAIDVILQAVTYGNIFGDLSDEEKKD